MTTTPPWDWPDPKGQRRLDSIGDRILWSYSALTVTRIVMENLKAGKPDPYPDGRTKPTSIMMTHYMTGRKSISTLDRDDRLAQDGAAVCAHCGSSAPRWHFDHLITQSSLRGAYIPLNQLRSCPRCNTGRGNKDLMLWHRQNRTFPSLAVLRRYLKLCHGYAEQHGCLTDPAANARSAGLPFDPTALPRKLPPVEHLVWDHAYSGL